MATTITLAPEFEERLDKLTAETGRDKSYFLRELVERGLDDLEDYYLAAKVMERVRAGTEKTYSTAEVRQKLGLED